MKFSRNLKLERVSCVLKKTELKKESQKNPIFNFKNALPFECTHQILQHWYHFVALGCSYKMTPTVQDLVTTCKRNRRQEPGNLSWYRRLKRTILDCYFLCFASGIHTQGVLELPIGGKIVFSTFLVRK